MEDSMNRNGKLILSDKATSSYVFGVLIVCIGILLHLGATPAWSQSTSSGSVTGQVTDPRGAIVPGADVTLLDVATNTPRKTSTNEVGDTPLSTFRPVSTLSLSRGRVSDRLWWMDRG